MKRKNVDKVIVDTCKDALDDAKLETLVMLFALPVEVLRNDYGWGADDISSFAERLTNYHTLWQNDLLSMEKMEKDLWEFGGIRFQIGEK